MYSTTGFNLLKIIFIMAAVVVLLLSGEASMKFFSKFLEVQTAAGITLLVILAVNALCVYLWDEHLSWRR